MGYIGRDESRTLAPPFADCQIVRARGSKRQGAVAAIIEHLFDARVAMLVGEEEIASSDDPLSSVTA